MERVFIVILNYRNWHDVVECLESVFRSEYQQYTIVVIDNNSGNQSLEHLMEWTAATSMITSRTGTIPIPLEKPIPFLHLQSSALPATPNFDTLPQLVLIQHDRNNGFAEGNNVALRWLQHETGFIWMLNPDMVVETDSISKLIDCAYASSTKTIYGCQIRRYDSPEDILLWGGGKVNFSSATVSLLTSKLEENKLDYITGGALFLRSADFLQLGLLPEDYFLYWEETDWCFHAKQKGYQFVVCADCICYDKGSTTIGKSYLSDYYYTRNGLKFVAKYQPASLKTALYYIYLRLLKRVVSAQWKRARGMWDGVRAFQVEHDGI